jgi:trigger factor
VRLVTVRTGSGTRAGRLEGDEVVLLAEPDVGALLAKPDWRERASAEGSRRPFSETALAPVIPRPSRIVCLGLNYRSHAAELGREPPARPVLFAKFADALVGPRDAVVLPWASERMDWEAELAFVVGRPGRHVPASRALEHVAGYTVLNDVSARDWQYRTSQYLQGKTFEATTPLGPALVTADELPPGGEGLRIWCSVDGETVQDDSTSGLVFSVAEVVAYLSTILTLRPGDLVSTGTPAGVGQARTPPRFLRPGQVLRTGIEGIGELVNPCVAEGPPVREEPAVRDEEPAVRDEEPAVRDEEPAVRDEEPAAGEAGVRRAGPARGPGCGIASSGRAGWPAARSVGALPPGPVDFCVRMRATAQPLEANKVKLSVEIEEAELAEAIDDTLRRLAREVRLPGFRPGKVPRRLIEARMGRKAVREEALRRALPEFYERALKDAELDAIADPKIDVTGGEESGPVTFDALVEVRPQVSVAGYQGLVVTIPDLEVGEEEVDAQLDRLRDQFAELQPVSRPARRGDHVVIDVKAYRHDQTIPGLTASDYSYEVGSGALVARLDEELDGARAGDILKFTAEAGAEGEVGFQVLVKGVREKVRPELTDEWAQEASEFDTLEALRADIRERLRQAKRVRARLALPDLAVEALVALVPDEPPDSLVGREMSQLLEDLVRRLERDGVTLEDYLRTTGRDQEGLLAELRARAARAVKADLALRALVRAEGIVVSDEEVDEEIGRLAERLGERSSAVRRRLEHSAVRATIRSDLEKAKAVAWLTEHVGIVDGEGRPVAREELASDAAVSGGPSESAATAAAAEDPAASEPQPSEPTRAGSP